MLLHSQKKVFMLFFSLLFSIVLFHPAPASAAVLCTWEPGGPGDAGCREAPTREACQQWCAQLGRPCAPVVDLYPSCVQYTAGQQANAQNKANDQAQQAQLEKQRAELDRLQAQQNADNAGKCMCSIGDPDAALTPFDGATPDSCYDRNEKTGNGQGDNANINLYNCRWVLNEEVIPTGDKSTNDLVDKYNAENPLKQYQGKVASLNKLRATSVQGFIALVIKTATGIMGSIALVMMIYGGFLWMTSSGNSSQVEKAQNVIFYGALGIFVIFGSYALITFIFQAVNPVLTQ